ncbi:MAG: HlyC/CorC family transporter [Clostridia bacterium]|nr:HlyC/CorC family transporter [Clostridia bacterium]
MGIYIIIIVICLIGSAYFSATETAFSTLNRIRIKNLAEKGSKKAKLTLKLADDYDSLLSAILIGNNIVNILCSSVSTLLFVEILLKDWDSGESTTVSTLVLTVIVLLVGEITPKTLAKKYPEKFAMFSAPIIRFIKIILTPLSLIFNGWQLLLSKIFKSNDDDKGMTEEELISIVEEAAEEGEFDEEESTLIKSAIEFGDLEVGDIYTPRIDVTAINSSSSTDEIKKIFIESGFSRIPVYDDDIDNISGILYYKDFYAALGSSDDPAIKEIIKPVIYVAKTQKVNDLMKELQEKQLHLAVVTDEFGSTAGLVTLEDILEEIVGDIWDEHDEIVEEFKEIGEKEYIASGKAIISKVFDELEIDEDPEALTVNGWAMQVLGRIPQENDEFEASGLSVKVLKMNGRRIENVHITDVRVFEEDEEDSKRDKDSDEDEAQAKFEI